MNSVPSWRAYLKPVGEGNIPWNLFARPVHPIMDSFHQQETLRFIIAPLLCYYKKRS
jgi:hypothetical protein